MIENGTGLLTIGELARATGLTVRTIRYWSDEGALPPVARSTGGHRLYDAASVARLELIRTPRELGLGLDAVRRVLAGETTVARVASAYVAALDAQGGVDRLRRAFWGYPQTPELARLSAAERRRILLEFVDEMFHGLDTADPVIRERMRSTVVDLSEEPTPEQVDAWVELAELLKDPRFRAQMRKAAEFNAADRGPDTPAGASMWFVRRLVQLAAEARQRGIAPESPEAEAEAVLRDLIGDAEPAAVLERLRSMTNDRVARYRELPALGTAAGRTRRTVPNSAGWSPHWRPGRAVNLTCVSTTARCENHE